MTTYEQYEDVAKFIKRTLSPKVFMEGEAIKVKPPFVVLRSYGVDNEYMNRSRIDTMGYSVYCYGVNRGRVENMISDVMEDLFFVRTGSNLQIIEPRFTGFINRLEDTLYEGIVSFTVESCRVKSSNYVPPSTLTADSTLITADSTAYSADATIR